MRIEVHTSILHSSQHEYGTILLKTYIKEIGKDLQQRFVCKNLRGAIHDNALCKNLLQTTILCLKEHAGLPIATWKSKTYYTINDTIIHLVIVELDLSSFERDYVEMTITKSHIHLYFSI